MDAKSSHFSSPKTITHHSQNTITKPHMLHWSSCLIATIVLHAYYKRPAAVTYHHLFLLLTVTSILFHCMHHPMVRIVDKFLAHMAYVMVLLDTPKALEGNALWLLIFPLMAGCAWFAQSLWPEQSTELHLGLHLISVVGMHTYLCVLY